MTSLPAAKVLDLYFLELRSKLLDLGAGLDRIERGPCANSGSDPRLVQIAAAIDALADGQGNRAERILRVFSLEYQPGWKRPEPR
jgi:hypothetical protein